MKNYYKLLPLCLFIFASCSSEGLPSEEISSQEVSSHLVSSETYSSEEEIVSSEEISSELVSSEIEVSSELDPVSEEVSSEHYELRNPMNEPLVHEQYYLNHIGDIYNTWKSYRGRGITIAVIDKGFNPNHEDLTFADGTSKVSDLSASFTTTGTTTSTSVGVDKVINMADSHGTFCAGVAAAGINGKGVVGIAPEASLLLLKTDGKPKSISKAFKYAADNGAKVVTISIGTYNGYDGEDLTNDGSNLTTVFDEPVQYCLNKGTVVISAGGNGGLDGRQTEYTYPGAAQGVIGCGGLAANSSDAVWSGSSYNYSRTYEFCDVFAPADGMFNICHFNRDGRWYDYDGGWNGTSFASPIVAGMAALYFEKNPSATPSDFQRDLYATCVKLPNQTVGSKNLTSANLGYGRVDVGKLLNTETTETITIKVDYNGSKLYAFAWDDTGTYSYGNANWPGVSITKGPVYYTVSIDASKYQNIIFNTGSDVLKTVDLKTSSFVYGNVYNLNARNAATGVSKAFVVKYNATSN